MILPWRRADNLAVLAQALRDGGIEDVRVTRERYPLPPSDWPLIVMGSGLRRIAVDLGAAAPDVLAACERWEPLGNCPATPSARTMRRR